MGKAIKKTPCELLNISDGDGNVYHAVSIGTQCWLTKNLSTTRFNDGTPIPNVTDNLAWGGLSSAAYCWYNNDASNGTTYGAIYNWYTIDTNETTKIASNGGKSICPVGWHVPSDAEWTTLANFLGGESVAGGKLKEEGISHWNSPNLGATNETGFISLPGGFRTTSTYFQIRVEGWFWSSTELGPNSAGDWQMHYNLTSFRKLNFTKTWGNSIRCLKD
jgi:uncharacterized protein (TIGR02145 family)